MRSRAYGLAAAALLSAVAIVTAGCKRAHDPPPAPEPDAAWVRPGPGRDEAVWGTNGGLAVGLWPTSGPRGLIRVYTPYLGQQFPRMLTYIAVEPVIGKDRGQSELERGPDGREGLPMASGDTAESAAAGDPAAPARGVVEGTGLAQTLSVWVAVGPFRNGSRPLVRVILRADRPREVAFRFHSAPGGARMDSCVLTATMGNYARLRRLWLRGGVVEAGRVWPTFEPDPLGFAPWRAWKRDRLLAVDGNLMVAAEPTEADPAGAAYEPAVPPHWRYTGRPATQYWSTPEAPGAVARVNGRTTYWGGGGPIPGGVSFENFELEVPFAAGQEFRFGVTPDGPTSLGFDPTWAKRPAD